jgi:hypothetical protein
VYSPHETWDLSQAIIGKRIYEINTISNYSILLSLKVASVNSENKKIVDRILSDLYKSSVSELVRCVAKLGRETGG